jgi:hypothetical protein
MRWKTSLAICRSMTTETDSDRSEDADLHGPFVDLRHGLVDRSNETPRRDAVAYPQTGTVRLHWSSRQS